MSFISEVFSPADDHPTLQKKLPLIASEIASYKREVVNNIDDVYYKFSEWPKHNQRLLDVSSQLSTDLTGLQRNIQEVTIKEIEDNNVQINNLSEELRLSNTKLTYITRIIEINESLAILERLLQEKSLVKASHVLVLLEELLGNLPHGETITKLRDKVKLGKVSLLESLEEEFQRIVEVHSKATNNVQTHTIKITKRAESVTEIFKMLHLCDGYGTTLDCISEFIVDVCNGVIHYVTTIKHQNEGAFYVLVVAVKKTPVKCSHTEVFAKLSEIFAFLYAHFDYSIGDDLTTMRYFGNTSGFVKMLVADCLECMKLPTEQESAAYEAAINAIVTFQSKLVEFNIFENDNALLQYAKTMDELLIEQKCNQYIAGAISLMKRDLHDSVEIGDECSDGNLLAPEQFPRSFISRSVLDIIQLVRTLLEEALELTDHCAARLICTAQSIFYQYGNIVHGHHERLLLTIPQQVALFRNNCLYIAHILTQMNVEYNKFPPGVLPSPPLFTEQGHQLQTIGGEIFLGYIDDQVRMMEVMLDQYLSPSTISDKLNPELEKLLRQCLRQYELLRTVWIKILPHSVYNKSIGYLFNAFCKKLILAVANAPDIPKKNAEQIVETFKVILARGPKLFSSVQEVGLCVESWPKLNDLVFILNANLAGISDMWADGKGVLTLTFRPEEVRNLIKALFQNTPRRAAVLSTIR